MALREQPINTNMVQFALSQTNCETFVVTIDIVVDGKGMARGRQTLLPTNGHNIGNKKARYRRGQRAKHNSQEQNEFIVAVSPELDYPIAISMVRENAGFSSI